MFDIFCLDFCGPGFIMAKLIPLILMRRSTRCDGHMVTRFYYLFIYFNLMKIDPALSLSWVSFRFYMRMVMRKYCFSKMSDGNSLAMRQMRCVNFALFFSNLPSHILCADYSFCYQEKSIELPGLDASEM